MKTILQVSFKTERHFFYILNSDNKLFEQNENQFKPAKSTTVFFQKNVCPIE